MANLLIDHLVLVAINELNLNWSLRVALAQLLIVKVDRWEFIVHFINKIVAFVDLPIVAAWASINLHEVSG